jgi:hypothetical protein
LLRAKIAFVAKKIADAGWSLDSQAVCSVTFALAAEVSYTNGICIFDLRRNKMKLSPPKNITWFIALALAVLAVLGHIGTVAALAKYDFWLAIVSAALLLIATLVKGL